MTNKKTNPCPLMKMHKGKFQTCGEATGSVEGHTRRADADGMVETHFGGPKFQKRRPPSRYIGTPHTDEVN